MIGRLAGALMVAVIAVPLSSAIAQSDDGYAESLLALQRIDGRVQSIGWKLVKGNARFCSTTRLSVGLLLQDIPGYNRPDDARNAVGVQTDFAIQAVAEGSPAARAGLLPNQPISAIDGQNLAELVRDAKATFLRLQWAEGALQHGLNTNGSVSLSVPGTAEQVILSGEAVCAANLVVRPSDDGAAADARSLYIGGKFPGLTYPDDELAAAMAHELAHVLLRHPQWLSENGRKRRDIRATEREADRMMPWLLANAGFEPQAATRFMQRWGTEEDNRFLAIRRTHDGWDERVELIEAELPSVRAAMARDGVADWSKQFARKQVN
ncbi:hypothetical protein QWY75_11490 [Pontixanthobacter aestiaquae]|uniref:PDZ domain-containing protein n=1 Tax=Pontixanthobacter aestiaquae TaxID=1509367 RepID=A0A844Z3W0_9SPHN|nr:hypothetical protein [Pontixanthobacter aestiaquae]MDN3646824.1 hypothetical protein [Pontixanthobacter aestiaquae]MXO82194.1 hypothetical protein [Pontixanthobacter aestiaquae]